MHMNRCLSKDSLFSVASEAPCSETFNIGENVQTSDRRIGRVAFVGRTEFQGGDWVGIVLDQPDGKNNGSVNGIKYFECADKHGLFCRPAKLVKLRPSPQSPTPSTSNRDRPRAISPAISVAASLLSQAGATREHSPFAADFGYDIGDRVLTKDSRTGKCKFLNVVSGQVFTGILFDKPVGDTDGKYQGVQYFKCYPKYASFLPADQVIRAVRDGTLPPKIAPRQTKASVLRIEKGGDGLGTGIASTGWRGSRESLNSGTSGQVKTPPPRTGIMRQPNVIKENEIISSLKKCLQEKEAHLVHLSNELDERRCDSERLLQENQSLKLRVGEMDSDLGLLRRELASLQSKIDTKNMRLDELSFCFTESELQKKDLETKLSEMKLLPLFELKEETVEEQIPCAICGNSYSERRPLEEQRQPITLDTESQTEGEQRIDIGAKEQQMEAKEMVGMAVQTDDQLRTELGVQTTTEDRIIDGVGIIDSCSQTDNEQGTSEMAVQTDFHEQIVISTQTEQHSHFERSVQTTETEAVVNPVIGRTTPTQTDVCDLIEVAVQTDLKSTREIEIQLNLTDEIRNSPKQSTSSAEVLELNVMKLKQGPDISTRTYNSLQNSPESLSQKYREKCEEVGRLVQQRSFLNTIIADQQNTIENLKGVHATAANCRTKTMDNQSPSRNDERQKQPIGGIGIRANGPRVYCDYCEMFDLHPSEDCPKEEARQAERRTHDVE